MWRHYLAGMLKELMGRLCRACSAVLRLVATEG